MLGNLGFTISAGSWGEINFSLYTTFKKTTTTLKFVLQTINIFKSDLISYECITDINEYLKMGLMFSVSLNHLLAAALVVAATGAIPAISVAVSSQSLLVANQLKAMGSIATILNAPVYI